jgi:hypothetical protein
MVIRTIKDAREIEAFERGPSCAECGRRATHLGTGQAGIYRVVCYICRDCDIIYQLLTEKIGAPMFEEVEKDGKMSIVPDKAQEKCNVCACGFYRECQQ